MRGVILGVLLGVLLLPGPAGALGTDDIEATKASVHARKIAPQLLRTIVDVEARATGDAPAAPETPLVRTSAIGEVHVYVILATFRPDCVARLQSLGLRVEVTLPEFRLVQGWAPASALDAIAALDFVKEVRPPDYPVQRGAGATSSAGDSILRADLARTQFGVTGAGVKVGAISDGVAHLGDSVASGDLPADVEVLKAGSGNEGTAMLEIVHDLAPGAPLAFYAPGTSAEMVVGIGVLAAAGARVVVDDLGFFSEPKFEDGMVAEAVRAFATDGRVYVTAAGNDARRHYRAPYRRLAGLGYPSTSYAAVHNYAAAGTDAGNTVVVPPSCSLSVFLQWNNRWGASSDDLDLFLVRASDGAVLDRGIDPQDGTGRPFEAAAFTNRGGTAVTVDIVVAEFRLASPPSALIVDYFALSSCSTDTGLQYLESADSVFGHAAVSEVLSVGALPALDPTRAESYSSRGPASISFPVLEVRDVPNVSAVDCVSTRTGQIGFFFEPFCGTSAAAPHVAAIAALLMERSPLATSAEVRDVLTGTSVDLGVPGFDFVQGFGRVDAVSAVAAAPATTQVFLNAHAFTAGQTLTMGLWAQNPGGSGPLDLYVGAVLSDGVTVVTFSTPGTVSAAASSAAPGTLPPMQSLSPGATLHLPAFLSFAFPPAGTIPPGTYQLFSALVRAGSLADNRLDPGDVVDLSIETITYSP